MSAVARTASTNAARRSFIAVVRPPLAHAQALGRSSILLHTPSSAHPLINLIQRHAYSTETSTSGGAGGSFPPPGFNTEQAKKPLPDDEAKDQQHSSHEARHIAAAANETQQEAQKTEATGEAKSKAMHDMSLTELAANKAAPDAKLDDPKMLAAEKEQKKLTMWQKVKKEVLHYWDGTKLLATEVKISSRLALKMAAGYELTRRENRQLQRTVQDLGRLVPFSVFVIVPFAELLLPVALKLFPNLLPSTYEGQKSKDAKATSLRKTRKEVSSFLQKTLEETGLPVSASNAQSKEFTEFFRKVRATGESPSKEEVIKVCQMFKDDLTLDNLSRPQLVAMCRYMSLSTFGGDVLLRYHIRHRMRQIKRDDRAIAYEGVDSLSVPELQMACAARGLRTHGASPSRLREDLQQWLDLRLKYGVPSTLLVLSNAFAYSQTQQGTGSDEMATQIDALQAVLTSIPEELFHEIELEVHNAEGAATNKQRLEVLKEQQDLIEEENEQNDESAGTSSSSPRDDANIDEEQRQSASDSKQASPEATSSNGNNAKKATNGSRSSEAQKSDKKA